MLKGQCGYGWIGYDIYCYKLEAQELPWNNADVECENKGGNLASITNRWENNFIAHLIAKDFNACIANPCQHGRCVNKDGGYKCICSFGWTGQNCQLDINECTRNPCQHGRCVNNDGGYKCTCSLGWTGRNCQQDINECTRNPCQHGRCVNNDGGYKCTCSPGWTEQNCHQAGGFISGWWEYGEHRYKLFTDEVTWDQANTRCKKQGANLASINSREENVFIADLIKNGLQT
ncbi:PREDICTED: neurogenic locus notch homolog protein 1-like [Branchiostoma belcheri]|uniref:Neurogenic locus notch homolog protein 1-like n=1 Tax=Branchiostoma belcheri TaxID=7741 RepID=A0A6P4Z9S9_BRABE|nr:PREDICTED: neurogenic locus notch homolog protein 1-like [Branchiostoma belcheri]